MRVLISGGHGDIGSAIAKIFFTNNYEVFVPTRAEMDMSCQNSIDAYMHKNNDFDIFIHCVGVNNPQKFEDLSMENFSNTFSINTTSSLKILQAILPYMKAKKFGRIVHISSLWSQYVKAGRIAYAMSKSSLDALTRGLAVEFGEYNILVNSILPGFIDTKLTRRNLSEETIIDIEKHTPLGKLGSPIDIAEMTYFLASENNRFITGQSIKIDGGYTL